MRVDGFFSLLFFCNAGERRERVGQSEWVPGSNYYRYQISSLKFSMKYVYTVYLFEFVDVIYMFPLK